MGTMMDLDQSLVELRQTFRSRRTRSLEWRKSQLQAILQLLRKKEDKIFNALHQDLGKHPIEVYRDEIGVVEKSINHALSCLEKWMGPKKTRLPLVFFPASAQVLPEPLGLVLIFVSWNFPFSLAMDPLIGAISAGNVVVLKPSEHAPATSSLLSETIPLFLDSKAIKVIEGGAEVCEQLLQKKWDKIFFTGSQRVGRLIMSAAANHLTPVTLELGGKCPVILDSLSNLSEIKLAVKRIVGGKWGSCNGQACIAVDYVLVEDRFASVLINSLQRTIEKFYGKTLDEYQNLSRVVNKHHFNRLRSLLDDPLVAASIVYGGSWDEEKLMIQPTILLNPPLNSELMTEEIFGPLLPIITVDKIEESIDFINSMPKPLVIYALTKNEAFKKRILSETSSGTVTFNDILIQFLCDALPFGGVGPSGFGRYHGKYSFDTFSHEKAVLQRSYWFELEARYPPWNDFKLKFLRLTYKFDYFGLILLMLGLKK
ncbi:Aldehyde dehydrogenase domain [Dillenia turbinata]|uniref:Aldehyde dehydrogenase n=1 Tax=Dillenia turbinata TaxID=194707 RepID=A0AAN8V8K1_9MAGN